MKIDMNFYLNQNRYQFFDFFNVLDFFFNLKKNEYQKL